MSPQDQYAQRLEARKTTAMRSDLLSARIGTARLVIGIGIAIAGIALWQGVDFSPWLMLVPVALFITLVVYHARVRNVQALTKRAVCFYERGLTRLQDRWQGAGQNGDRFADSHHTYASDLDLFGKGGLFELLSICRTRMGESIIAQWLLSPATIEVIRNRQASLTELRDRLDLREDLAVLGEDVDVGVQPDALIAWANAESNQLTASWIKPIAWLLPIALATTAIVWSVTAIATPFLIVLLAEALVIYILKNKLGEVFHDASSAFANLNLLSAVIARIENEQCNTPLLQSLRQALTSHNTSASQAITRLRVIVEFIESRNNPFMRLLDLPLLYSVHVALAAERWRGKHASAVTLWLQAAGEFEALSSLASYAYEHPDDLFPEFMEGVPMFNAEGIGHPLIAAHKCVRNDLSIAASVRTLIISGSNMSGKSTLLRTIGVNTVLAMMGAPVRATRLQLTPLRVGASIRVNDSLQEGSSRFYAEIMRLRALYELSSQSPPLLFLLDELLQGTNSSDRRIGAQGIVRAFLDRNAIGLLSTHDLALTEIVGIAPDSFANFHFQDEIDNGRMKFDHRLRAGVVTKSNGLELMRSIGLQV